MTAVERAARDVLKPYVQAGRMRQAEVNKTMRDGLPIIEQTIRTELQRHEFGSTFYYGSKVTRARAEYEAATTATARHMKRVRLAMAEVAAAVYMAVRAEYKSAEEIEREDQEAPRMAAALDLVQEVVQEETERAAGAVPQVSPAA
ncbi:hypothetical protein ID875_20965 [Streptomyces globisporus]|uniref:Uncharacterized protein n=1 Tax=Streptomyces globisporus TaxID=1908 RepID=A0A927BLF1_STRGL|nr:hypothetical protein [Streptomyces globisporus]